MYTSCIYYWLSIHMCEAEYKSCILKKDEISNIWKVFLHLPFPKYVISLHFCINWLFCWFSFQKSGWATSLGHQTVFWIVAISIISLILRSLIKNDQQQNYFAVLHVNHPGLLIAVATNITELQYTVMFLLNLLNLKTKKLCHYFSKTNRSLCWGFLSSLWY